MKRFFAMTSTAAMILGTAAVAQDADIPTQAEMNAIMKYAPDATAAQITALSDERIDSIIGYISSGEDENDIRRHVQAMFIEGEAGASEQVKIYIVPADTPTASEVHTIMKYAPDATMDQIAAMSDQRVDSLISVVTSGETESEKRRYVRSVFQ